MLETMLDRAHGKAKQNIDTTITGQMTIIDGLLSLKKKQQIEEV